MAISRVHTWSSGEVLTASDLNSEFSNILNNPVALWSPAGAAASFNGQIVTLDAASATSFVSSSAVSLNFTSGAKTGTPATTGSVANWSAQTFTDSATAGSGTAAAFVAHGFQRPTLAATNASVVTTDAATVYIVNSPATGTNETLTNAWALWVDDGNTRLDGQICGIGSPVLQELRLTLTTALPVTTADVTGAGTIYLTPYTGSHITLYDGTIWKTFSTAEISLALTLTSGKPYDIFAFISSGAPALEVLVWTDDTTRATALAYQNGVPVKSGAATRRYLGTLYSSGANTTEDSIAKRYLWNYYNRVERLMRAVEATDTWTYTTATLRQANNNAANQLDMVIGVSEDQVEAFVQTSYQNSGTTSVVFGVGLDATNALASGHITPQSNNSVAATIAQGESSWRGLPGAGRHRLTWLEYSTASGTTTWTGDAGSPTLVQNGIHGRIRA